MCYKAREKIPIYGTVLMTLGCILILGILPCIPLGVWIYYNNKYVSVYESNDKALLEKYTRYIKRAKIVMIVVTVLSVVVEVLIVVKIVLTIVSQYNPRDCIHCSLRR